LGQLQLFIDVFAQERMGQLASVGPTYHRSRDQGWLNCFSRGAGAFVGRHRLHGKGAKLTAAALHPADPHLLATAATDRTVRLWDRRAFGGGDK
jgi:hypothetical protein